MSPIDGLSCGSSLLQASISLTTSTGACPGQWTSADEMSLVGRSKVHTFSAASDSAQRLRLDSVVATVPIQPLSASLVVIHTKGRACYWPYSPLDAAVCGDFNMHSNYD